MFSSLSEIIRWHSRVKHQQLEFKILWLKAEICLHRNVVRGLSIHEGCSFCRHWLILPQLNVSPHTKRSSSLSWETVLGASEDFRPHDVTALLRGLLLNWNMRVVYEHLLKLTGSVITCVPSTMRQSKKIKRSKSQSQTQILHLFQPETSVRVNL